MLPWILAALALFVVQSMLGTLIRYFLGSGAIGSNLWDALGGRDSPPDMPVLGARASRALTNMQEALFVFLPLAILAQIQGADGLAFWGAALWLGARVLYVPAYLTAIPGVRSTVWVISWLGLGALATSVVLSSGLLGAGA